mmetsp:Transcript_12098/g.14117  ORF Transcript_12098/g.14117 Transcript_12098/m.14117 type:complete len:631 (+) Transcript_12098:342-2234(+)|eukprot:CAMPEP_0204838878 /NCGR_PEP_ID=MMETSP1346-20131115/32323_1 /ASSEMBLY_ACC=CAM_ASM_000771 /TAXON_ID=215587 /ORGANISM="Aplanochytrium stocchinoi, Strain GSBS06" /LENGTH=630 /DNA_ID=CAMNT_0051975215 /DNA_START=269 /DNA_END=2161 /DNA_ORIENTATION=-
MVVADEDVVCEVCKDGGWSEHNKIVFCEGFCEIAVHQKCYGVPIIPEGDIPWYCDVCTPVKPGRPAARCYRKEQVCILCLEQSGAMKPLSATSNKWVHVACAFAAPEVSFQNVKLLRDVTGVDSVALARRRNLSCSFCDRKNGMVVTCAADGCRESFHVRCGQNEGLKIELKPKAGRKRAYCSAHAFLFGHHDSLSSPGNKAAFGSRASQISASASGRGISCTDLWNESKYIFDDTDAVQNMKRWLQPKSETLLQKDKSKGKNSGNELLVHTIDNVLSRPEKIEGDAMRFTDLRLCGTIPDLLEPDKRMPEVRAAQQRISTDVYHSCWARVVMPVVHNSVSAKTKGNAKSPAKKKVPAIFNLHPRTPFNFRLFLDSNGSYNEMNQRLPLPDKREEIRSSRDIPMHQVGLVQSAEMKTQKSCDDELYAQIWRLESILQEETHNNRQRIAKVRKRFMANSAIRESLNPTAGQVNRAESAYSESVVSVQPSTTKKRKRGRSSTKADVARNLFIEAEESYFASNKNPLKIPPRNYGEIHGEVKMALEYMVSMIDFKQRLKGGDSTKKSLWELEKIKSVVNQKLNTQKPKLMRGRPKKDQIETRMAAPKSKQSKAHKKLIVSLYCVGEGEYVCKI